MDEKEIKIDINILKDGIIPRNPLPLPPPLSLTPKRRSSGDTTKRLFELNLPNESSNMRENENSFVSLDLSPISRGVRKKKEKRKSDLSTQYTESEIKKITNWNKELVKHIKDWRDKYEKNKNIYKEKSKRFSNYYWSSSFINILTAGLSTFVSVLLNIEESNTNNKNQMRWEVYALPFLSFMCAFTSILNQRYKFDVKAVEFLKYSEEYNDIVEIINLEIAKNVEDREDFETFSDKIRNMSNILERKNPSI